jgi:hypothetical protein
VGDVRVSLRFVFMFSSGATFESFTSNYASVEAAREMLGKALERSENILNWYDPDGSVRVLRVAHIVGVEISEAG